MNRLIIIGNGFDLAHNLETKYSDFIKYYWSNLKTTDELVEFVCRFSLPPFDSLSSLLEIKKRANQLQETLRFNFKNGFFRDLNEKMVDENWVDIEMFYYQKLKIYFKQKNFNEIQTLNYEFEKVKTKFEEYINHINSRISIENTYCEEIGKLFAPLHNHKEYKTEFMERLPYKFRNILDQQCTNYINSGNNLESKTMILSFNYTKTLNCYQSHFDKNQDLVINQIHGEAGNENNKIVFGFGDERDDIFGEMENINKNEFLHFMKSSFYLQNRNYFDLLNFIEDQEFIIEIFGHSCALSDRTLLKTIFENPNCAQIFLTYFSSVKNGVTTNNFLDLSLNISRHFDDKKLLRSRVANKEFCKMLPQKIK